MKITFFSNYLNHHQLPFCLEMFNLLGDDFHFVATEPVDKDRLKLGYEDMNDIYPFVIRTYEDKHQYNRGLELGYESDVVIIGSAPDILIKRLRENKLTFRYSERIFKRGLWRALKPRTILSMLRNHTKYRSKQLYMLCASAYTPLDMSLFKAYSGKMYKWGYFPEVKEYSIDDLISKKSKEIIEILWVGRMISWKHPEKAIFIAKRLKQEKIRFNLKFIGTGELENDLKKLVTEHNLYDCVEFLGAMPSDKVRQFMERANIFLFTSDFQEGWGAVLNEAMNSACAVVASHAIGSVPFLVKHGQNGLIYKNNDINDLYEKVKVLIQDDELRENISRNAYKTLVEEWNPKIAAKRIVTLSERLLMGERFFYNEGICSEAKVLRGKEVLKSNV